jgi:hypothetical protein
MLKRLCSVLLFCLCVAESIAQYLVGSGTQSIEPDSTVFSLALGGYGSPREGRFSLTWKQLTKTEPLRAVTCLNGKFYGVTFRGELIASAADNKENWRTLIRSSEIVALASGNGKLFAVNANNELLTTDATDKTIKWTSHGKIGYTIALAYSDGTVYGINDQRQVFIVEQAEQNPSVQIIGEAANTISLAARGNELYGLRSDNTIWKAKIGSGKLTWIKIARENGFSYNVAIKHIGMMNGRAFGVDVNGNIYAAAHNSRGDLISRTLAIKTGNKTALIVSVDLVGIKYDIVNEIKDSISKMRDIAAENILVNISHTHFVPVTQDWATWQPFNQEPDSLYLHGIVKSGIIKSIERALNNMKPASIYFGRGKTAIGHNRSSENGETPYDDVVDVIKVKYASSPVPDVLVLTACHPVFPANEGWMYTISANYPGVTRRVLEQKKVAGTALFLQGCAGDINPREPSDVQTGMSLAIDAMTVMQSDMKKVTGKISCFLDTVNVPVTPMKQEDVILFKNSNLNREGEVYAEKNVRWADLMIEKYKRDDIPSTLPVYVQTINIGSWKLVGLSREVVTDYSLGIKKLWPEKFVSVAGYCNDVSSYLPAESHIRRHTYEGEDSFYWYGETALFPQDVLDIILQQIKKNGR